MRSTFLLSSVALLLILTACGGGSSSGDGNNNGPNSGPDNPGTGDSATAFNVMDEMTFFESTCQNRPFEEPVGYFVSPSGKANASGTQEDPLDLKTALSANSPVVAGDTLWLGEGVYNGIYTSELSGTKEHPIKVKSLLGKRVILDGNVPSSGSALSVKGAWTEYYGLEVMNSVTSHTSSERGSNPSDLQTNGGVTVQGPNTKVINFIVHDNVGGGMSSWSNAPDSELYGNIIYNNGWTAPDRGHGHAIYAQNNTGFKKLTNNIIFFGYATGIHVYTENGQINNFDIEENTWFMTGASDPRASQKKDNCLVGGFQPVRNLLLKNNQGYSENGRGTRIGYGSSVSGQDAVLKNNYLSENFWVAGAWDSLNVSDTSVFRGLTGDSIKYINDLGGNDLRDTPPTQGKKVFVSANAYDPRRAKVVIYNFDEENTVSVDLSSVLKPGEAYRIHSIFALFDAPLLQGVYDGKAVAIPMGSVNPPQPTGLQGVSDDDDPHKRFGVFIVTHGACD